MGITAPFGSLVAHGLSTKHPIYCVFENRDCQVEAVGLTSGKTLEVLTSTLKMTQDQFSAS